MSDEVLDVAVIGGGVSGVYSAWRLITQGGKKKVTVFEAGDHIGGRLLSVTPPNIPNMKAELGGMRILPAVQPRITKLIEILNKGISGPDRIETYPFPVDEANNISYLRGVYLRLSDFSNRPGKVPYHLTFQEFGKTPGQILINAIEQIVPGITNSKLNEDQRREMTYETVFNGKPLYQQGFWQVLLRVISGEAYQLGLAAGGYETTITSWNAADAIPWFLSDFGIKPDYKGFRKGFQQVPLNLADRFQKAGGHIRCNAPAAGFEWHEGEKIVEVHLRNGDKVKAKHVVLAMPRRALELISGESSLLQQPAVKELIKSVTPRPLFKLFTTYINPWWLAAGVKAGRTTTDLPVRQTYYWPKDDGLPAEEGRAMLMASYDDGVNIGFWDSFRPRRGRDWRPEAQNAPEPEWYSGDDDQAAGTTQAKVDEAGAWGEYRAPKAMVREVQRQLAIIHGLAYTPKVLSASFKDWGDDPFGGGWNSWNIGVRSPDVKKRIIQPVDGIPVYICGEAYSDAQGWVEGALQTADMMLEDKEKFGLPPLKVPKA